MKIRLKVFFAGAVIFFITAPFLFGQSHIPAKAGIQKSEYESIYNFDSNLKLKLNKKEFLLPGFPLKSYEWIPVLPAFARTGMTFDSLKTDSSSATKLKTNKKFKMKKSPTIAVLLSAALPGAGQFYNESYWKIPIIGGLVGYFGYEYFRQNNLFKDYRDQYSTSQTPENPNGDISLKTLREFYRNQRDDFVWYFMIVYVVNLIDAYVDAHLFDFDVKEEKLTHFGKTDRTYRLKFNVKF